MDLNPTRGRGGKPAVARLSPRRPVHSWLAGLVALIVQLPGARAETPGPLPLIVPLRAVAAGAVAPEGIRALCGRLPRPCRVDDTRVYTEGKAKDGVLWLIDAAKPSLVRWNRVDGKAEQWDFSAYVHSSAAGDDGADPSPLILHPALYPGVGE